MNFAYIYVKLNIYTYIYNVWSKSIPIETWTVFQFSIGQSAGAVECTNRISTVDYDNHLPQ